MLELRTLRGFRKMDEISPSNRAAAAGWMLVADI